jgi:hypothetical protein
MNENQKIETVSIGRERVEQSRQLNAPEALANALESYAAALMQTVDVATAAQALEEAGSIWTSLNRWEQAGSCRLLAAASFRMASQPESAGRVLSAGLALPAHMPERLRRGFDMEHSEQHLAAGRYEAAIQGFTKLIDDSARLDPPDLALILQRRGAAAITNGQPHPAADDFLHAAGIYRELHHHADAEACTLAAAAGLAFADPLAAEAIVGQVATTVPSDGAAAYRRGMVGGRVAMEAGDSALALKRFDLARQAALDVRDPISYLAAASAAAQAAERLNDMTAAYGRLAAAWASLADLAGKEAAREMVRPLLRSLRERLGNDCFADVKDAYEHRARTLNPEP